MMATRRSLRSKIENNLNNNKIKKVDESSNKKKIKKVEDDEDNSNDSKTNENPSIDIKVTKPEDDDDGSSSDSSVGNYLKTADEIDLNSSFFSVQANTSNNSSTTKRKSDVGRLSDLSGSDSEPEEKPEIKDVEPETSISSFQGLENFHKKLEETKKAVQKYEKKRAKKETKLEISNLLSVGEKSSDLPAVSNQENFMTDSSEDEMDWEDVDHSIEEPVNKIPKEGVEITVAFPGKLREKKTKDDVMMSMKRKINRIKKENQVYMHKVHLLCWIAHGNYINSVLNNENLLGVSLSLLPSEQCYPPKHADLGYLEQITKWFGKVIKVIDDSKSSPSKNKMKSTENKSVNLPLEKSLELQLIKKEAESKKFLVYMYICILRALGLSCRLVLSLQPVPLRPPSSELCSLSTKNNGKGESSKTGKKIKSENDIKSEEKKSSIKSEEKKSSTKSGGEKKGKETISSKIKASLKSEEKKKSTEIKTEKVNSNKRELRVSLVKIDASEEKIKNDMKSSEKTKPGNSKTKPEPKRSQKTTEKTETKRTTRTTTSTLETSRSKRSKSTPNYSTADDSEDDFEVSKRSSINSRSAEKSKGNSSKSPDKSKRNPSEKTPDKSKRSSSENSRSPDKSKNSPIKRQLDVRSDIVKLIKGDMLKSKQLESEKLVKKIKKEESEDSDYMPEEPAVKKRRSVKKPDSEDEFKKKKIAVKKPTKSGIDSRVLSTDSDDENNDTKKKVKNGNDVWAEVFLEAEEKWISVDVIKGQVHCISELYSRATSPVCYVLAWSNNRSIKDVTSRYCPHMNTVTRKLRVESEWWNKTLKPYIGKKTARDKEEDEDLARQQLDQPLPKTISEYKNHPLYALKRHLLKFEAIYPPDAVTLGFVRNEPVYARECVHTLHSREIWLKHAKVVKLGEQPYKIVKARPKYDKLTGQTITDKPLEIFGMWQVQDYEPPTAENGIVPRNAFGNVELFKPCMLPKKTVHLQLPGLNKVARKLRIDCAPALTGFDYHSGGCHPTYDGFVVCEEFKDTLIAAWEQDQEETYQKEIQKIEKRVYDNWRKLIKGLLIRERLKIKYEFESTSKKEKKSKKSLKVVAKKRKVVSDNESD